MHSLSVFGLAGIFVLTIGAQAPAEKEARPGQLPDAPGKELVVKLCSGCHELELVVARPRTRNGWEENVDDMVGRGVKGSDEDLDKIVTYLTRYFGRLNINAASAADMQSKLEFTAEEARAVIAFRDAHGKIADFDELKKVKGLDEAKLKAKRPQIAFAP